MNDNAHVDLMALVHSPRWCERSIDVQDM